MGLLTQIFASAASPARSTFKSPSADQLTAIVIASRAIFTTKLSGGDEFGYYVLVPTGEITHCDAMPGHKSPQSWIARANRRGCFIIAIVLVLTLLALAYVGFSANPINELNAIIPTRP